MADTEKKAKKITAAQLKKKLNELPKEELVGIILSMRKSTKSVEEMLSFYFSGDAYRDAVMEKCDEKLQNAAWKSMDELLEVERHCEDIIFTGDASLDAWYKAKIWLDVVKNDFEYLDAYGGGPDRYYSRADSYFSKVCSYVCTYAEKNDLKAADFYVENDETVRDIIGIGSALGYGFDWAFTQQWKRAEEAAKKAQETVIRSGTVDPGDVKKTDRRTDGAK